MVRRADNRLSVSEAVLAGETVNAFERRGILDHRPQNRSWEQHPHDSGEAKAVCPSLLDKQGVAARKVDFLSGLFWIGKPTKLRL